MKLLAKYSRINLLITILIFLTSGFAYYFLLSLIFLGQLDDDLKIEETEIGTYVNRFHSLPHSISVNDQLITYTPVSKPSTRTLSTIKMAERKNEDAEAFRQLVFSVQVNGIYYNVAVAKSLEDTDALIRFILLITCLTIISVLIASFIINRIMVKKLWKPFYNTLDKVRHFQIGKRDQFTLPSQQIEEFAFMNQAIQQLVQQAQRDYLSLKTFSENASHEIQTPLAIIRSKLDLLIQDDHVSDTQSRLLQSIYLAVDKLSRINHSLLLLTKIENNQYGEKQPVNIKDAIEEKLNEFQELWQAQNIGVHSKLGTATISINPELLDILLNNLFSNATRYNYSGGSISIELSYEQLKITNTSKQPRLAPGKMFQRFYKGESGQNENSLGLGLYIIRQICQSSGFATDYFFSNASHIFIIRWR